jgi:hypothetical protein
MNNGATDGYEVTRGDRQRYMAIAQLQIRNVRKKFLSEENNLLISCEVYLTIKRAVIVSGPHNRGC